MTRIEFAEVMAWISVGIGKPIAESEQEKVARLGVYFDCLGDLPLPALQLAAKRCVLERKYQSFPPVAELRELAVETTRGEVKPMSGADAWGIAMKAVGRCDVDVTGSVERAFAKVPEPVKRAVEQFGFMALYNLPSSNMETARAQFIRLFESIAELDRKTALLPVAMQKQIAMIGKPPALPAPTQTVIAAIGTEKE